MAAVKNIETHEDDYGDIIAKVKRAYPFVAFDEADKKRVRELTPQHSRRITFDIAGVNTALANGWRRVMLDEIVWPRLTCEMTDIRSDDVFNAKLTDYIQNRIQLVPTTYIPPPEGATSAGYPMRHPDLRLTVDIKNTTQQNMIIKSGDIKWSKKDDGNAALGGATDYEKVFRWDGNVDLCNLAPGRQIRISIGVEWGRNRDHASFSNFHGLVYRPLTVPDGPFTGKAPSRPLDFSEAKLPNSYSVHPDSYRLGLTCEAFIDPLQAAQMGWHVLKEKLETVQGYIIEFQAREKERGENAMPYMTDHIKVVQTRGGVVRYEFMGETYTLTNTLAWYVYKNGPDITNVLAGDDHPEDPSGLVRIVHKKHSALLVQATRDAIADIDSIIKGLAK